jgi:UDP-glucuronate decarboxylase
MKRLLITGGSGFIGKHVVQKLWGENFEVYAPRSTDLDLLNTVQVRDYVCRIQPSHLLHLAWMTKPGMFFESPENIHWVEATLALAQAFVESGGKRFVGAGTCFETVLGEFPTFYGTCKDLTRELLQVYFSKMSTEFVWARLFFLYGPYEKPERLIPSVVMKLLTQELVKCSSGTQIRDYLYVEDCARILVKHLDSKHQGVLEIASGIPVTIGELVMRFAKAIGREDLVRLGALPDRVGEPKSILPDNKLVWQPEFSFEEGVARTIAYWSR